MHIILKSLIAASILTASSIALAAPNTDIRISSEVSPSGNFTGDDPAIYDLGQDLAIVFFYDNDAGKRVVVTTIAPKDPDSGRHASEHIVTLNDGETYSATLASSDVTIAPVKIAVGYNEVPGLRLAHQ